MHLDDAAELRRRYTGESRCGAKAELRRLPAGDPLIPRSSGDQEFLEAEVLRGLLEYPSTYTTRPFRVLWVIPRPTGMTIRFAADADADGLTDFVAWGLFPAGGEDDMRGIPGLRLVNAGHNRMDVGLLGTRARIRLEGVPSTSWREVEAVRQRAAGDAGETAPFRHPELTLSEKAFTQRHSWLVEARRGTAALGSALLRRLGLFRTAADWHDMAGYTKYSDTFAFRMTFTKEMLTSHAEFLRQLTQPDCGIPIVQRMAACSCATGGTDCRLYLTCQPPYEGRVELQFATSWECSASEIAEVLRYAGSPESDIARYVPLRPGLACRHDRAIHGRTLQFLQGLAGSRRAQRAEAAPTDSAGMGTK
ncbi:hypothetical protein Kpho02_72520 [Kitasatospora phosalacinea]|uniref:Uncharacterized protein n=1 Tax=Kitasatospora phosalacinea TaxID=2065 RepID=A0A9W6QD46_9ACTN|nr:hypothetical protein [Kitasatospora phosalacinea]GLW74955.1 hypothetical protein Kpho02_72520 [Kitasatospora phosalacinea]